MAPLVRERLDTRPAVGALSKRQQQQHEAVERLIALLDPMGTDAYMQAQNDILRLARLRAARARYVLCNSDGVALARNMRRSCEK
ncbi:hypothetical protein CTKA_01010 [Chthonomonas calidirosea]|uniref:Uncharacterized protein n=1 Tax=Chthonomonas calidirosea (strain DSM 23976 / ICMP 18418 / T49) TaxID=1303518 RepID=S0ES62_CHTCT|nr:hypothetical protein [Chthonomonas calidirosea]CCW33986.1 hypothetical protein CCALI_00148 [Chthonomonas calidirosea T49]CEK16090.1 hypothetical protein CTKA_01010 [Chthonomonas calidirosea]